MDAVNSKITEEISFFNEILTTNGYNQKTDLFILMNISAGKNIC